MSIAKLYKDIQIPLYLKIILSFMVMIFALTFILSVGTNYAKNSMRRYFEEKTIERYESVVSDLEEVISSYDWSIDDPVFYKRLEYYHQRNGMDILLEDTSGNILFGIPRINVDKIKDELTTEEEQDNELKIMDQKLPVELDGEIQGYVRVIFVGTFLARQGDAQLYDAMQNIFRYSIILCMIITIIISVLIARSVTSPLKKVGLTATAISNGDLKARAKLDTNTKELVELSKNINTLASKLEREDILRVQVTSDMAHEIRTPLTSLRNFFEAFIDGVYEVNEENLLKCHSEIIRMSDLVNRLKDIASIEEMTIRARKESFDITEVTKDLCDLSKPAFDKKHIALNFHGNDVCHVVMDEGHLRQSVSNLISNSLRYTDEGGNVDVIVKATEDFIEISVSDDGIGMSQKDTEDAFERFYRADKSRDRASGGLGVGLTIVKKLVEFYGGTVKVKSQLGVGTIFTITYPREALK